LLAPLLPFSFPFWLSNQPLFSLVLLKGF
jgi:hypothetical protein